MTWGFFTLTHILTMIAALLIIVGMHFLLRGKNEKTQTIVLGSLSFLGIIAIIYQLLTDPSPMTKLPFHLCSLNAMMLPIAVLTKNKVINNLLIVWSLGALVAIILNNEYAHHSIFSWVFFFYYFPHVVEFGIPILMFTLKHAKLDVKCIISTIGITLVAYTIIHFINVWINSANLIDKNGDPVFANYMFSMAPNNPVLDLFRSWIPYNYWYMYLVLPIVAVYLSCIYCMQIKDLIVNRKNKKQLTNE